MLSKSELQVELIELLVEFRSDIKVLKHFVVSLKLAHNSVNQREQHSLEKHELLRFQFRDLNLLNLLEELLPKSNLLPAPYVNETIESLLTSGIVKRLSRISGITKSPLSMILSM